MLISPDQFIRLLNMDLIQIIRFIGETTYKDEINRFSGKFTGLPLIETALTQNLASTYHSILNIAPGGLKKLASLYFSRYDIENVMLIIRGHKFHISADKIREVLIPAGYFSEEKLETLINVHKIQDIPGILKTWDYSHILSDYLKKDYEKGLYARLENDLYQAYYTNLLLETRYGIRSGQMLVPQLRFEIDIINIRNIFRLRAGSSIEDIKSYIIPGGNQNEDYFQRFYQINEREQLISEIKRANILDQITRALRNIRCDSSVCEEDAADMIWRRWEERKTPLYTVMLAVNRTRLHHLDGLSRRSPFSVLPIISFLEHKRYEVANLRAITRGKQFDIGPDFIRQHLVL